MIERHRASSSSLFLMELILSILFFCIASTICISIFVRSHGMNNDSVVLNKSIREISNTAEIITSCDTMDSIEQELQNHYEGIVKNGNTMSLNLDDELNATSNTPSFVLSITLEQNGSLLNSDISVNKNEDNSVIYNLNIEHCIKEDINE